MFLEFTLFALLGFMIGLFTGLLPGLHVNSLAFVFSLFAFSVPLYFAVFVVSLSLTHAVLDFVPSILFSAPSEETLLSILPGHRLLLQGKAHTALMLSMIGALFGVVFTVLWAIPLSLFLMYTYSWFRLFFPFLIVLILCIFVLSVPSPRAKVFTLIALAFSGLLGLLLLSGDFISEPLFPAITGLFGASSLLYSLFYPPRICSQLKSKFQFPLLQSISSSFHGFIAGFATAIFPALSVSVTALMIRKLLGKMSTEQYLVLLGSASISGLLGSLITLYSLGLTRTGTAVLVKETIEIAFEDIVWILGTALFAVSLSVIFVFLFAHSIVRIVSRLPYRFLTFAILVFLVILVYLFTGFNGFLILVLSSCIGLIPLFSHTSRSPLMAFLLVPTFCVYALF